MSRRMVLLTWGHTNPGTAKTAAGLLRYCPEECLAILDPDQSGKTADDCLQVGGNTPIVASLDDVPEPRTLVIGIAPPGGRIPAAWRAVVLDALCRKMNVLSGLHDFLTNDAEFVAHAAANGCQLIDVRKNEFREIARYPELNPKCCRIHTVGHDCSVGKMVVSLELSRGLQRRGYDAHFVATGQTGIMVSGEGLPIDCVAADFVSGAAERLVVDAEQHQFLLIEGQGSLVHPSYSAVTLGLLHGCRPHALVFVFEAGRTSVGGLDHVTLPALDKQIALFETLGSVHAAQPCKVIGLAMNGRRLTSQEAAEYGRRVEAEVALPVVDVLRDGPDRLLDVVESFYQAGVW